ncbi:FecR family protein [Burkholderia guangdongensis]|uniref:FecR family protein n=1 Tax=Burkholderia guangdongensis TaxID=1792500 RepID=UPI0031B5D424
MLAALPAHDVAHAAETAIGHAIVVVGRACVKAGTAGAADVRECVPLKQGAAIAQGDTIETGADGYVYVTTVDKGFISVRPDSELSVDRYEYDPAHPHDTVINLSLRKGVVREISGEGARAARDKYRMNTPVAALGIRGTDFSVFTDTNVTRAEVRSGGIVMTPLGAGCTAAAVGPCEGPASTELYAARQSGALLQLYRGSVRPDVIQTPQPQLMPDQVVPALKNEDNAAHAAAMQSSMNPPVTPDQLAFQLQAPATTQQPTAPAPAAPATQQPEAQQIFWGRYAPLASLPANASISSLTQNGGQQIGIIGPYAMVRTPQSDMTMPTFGNFTFALQPAMSEAYISDPVTHAVDPAQFSNAQLSIDFGANAFKTSFNLTTANGSTYAIAGHGGVSSDGQFYSDLDSLAAVRGGLAGKNATQAGYVFQELGLAGGKSANGATQWSR